MEVSNRRAVNVVIRNVSPSSSASRQLIVDRFPEGMWVAIPNPHILDRDGRCFLRINNSAGIISIQEEKVVIAQSVAGDQLRHEDPTAESSTAVSSKKSGTFDKKCLVDRHQVMMTEAANDAEAHANAQLQNLITIDVADLTPKAHLGRVLTGRLCVTPFQLSVVQTIIEDSTGRAMQVSIHNAVPLTLSDQIVVTRFPSGLRVGVAKPFLLRLKNGRLTVVASDPSDVLSIPDTEDADIPDVKGILKKLHDETTGLRKTKDWVGADTQTAIIHQATKARKKMRIEAEEDLRKSACDIVKQLPYESLVSLMKFITELQKP